MPVLRGGARGQRAVALTWPSSPPEWNAYVEAGKDLAERRSRLAEVPEPWREGVKRHVALVFKIRAQLARKEILTQRGSLKPTG